MRESRRANPLFLIVFGGVFALIGAATILLFACKTTFICTRTAQDAGECSLIHEKILGTIEEKIPLNDIVKAYVDTDYDDDGTTYCVILQTALGEMEFSPTYSSGSSDKYRVASKINNFINNKGEKSLYVVQDDRFLDFLLGGLFVIVGGAISLGGLVSLLRRI